MATSDPGAIVVFCTVPDESTAERVAKGLVEGGLAACVNVLPGIRSLYRWKGELQDDDELQLIIKSQAAKFVEIEAWMGEHHPYDVPELVALPVALIGDAYWEWMAGETGI